MNPWTFLVLWAGSQTLQLVFCGVALLQTPVSGGQKRIRALVVSGIASLLPLITLMLFLRVFVIGGSSNVAQIAGESGMDLWSLWFGVWPLLFVGNPAAFLAAVVALFLPPYSPASWPSILSRVCAGVAAGCAFGAAVTYFPDA